jgi:membrane associated rhomboid family serine protease
VTAQIALLLCASMVAMQLVALILRREVRDLYPYALLLGADLALLGYAHATRGYETLVAFVGEAVAGVLIFGARALDTLELRARRADQLGRAARIAQVRELLVPGRASSRRRRQLEVLAEARAGKGGEAVRRLRAALEGAADARLQLELHEELALALFLERRLPEAVAHVERYLGSELERRPLLIAHLVTAYGELGRLDEAARALGRVERGPLGGDPGAGALLFEPRLSFLAYAGAADEVAALLEGAVGAQLPAAARQYFRRLAEAHRGETLSEPTRALVAEVARRALVTPAPRLVARRRGVVTLGLVAANLCVFGALLFGRGADELLLVRAGALFRPAVLHGEWWRVLSAAFLHAGWLHLGVNMYGLYLLGRFAEELLGPARFFVVYLAGALGGGAASTLLGPGALSVGASGAIMGLLGALIVVLMLRRGRWPEAWRRTLLWNLVFLGALQIYVGFQVAMIDNAAHVGGMVAGAAATGLFAPEGLFGEGRFGRALTRLCVGAGLAALLVTGARAATTSLDTTLARLPTRQVTVGGVALTVPAHFEVDAAHGRVEDPYLGIEIEPRVAQGGIVLGSPQADEPRLHGLLERVQRSARLP